MGEITSPYSSLHNVFVYGTLLADEVTYAVIKRVPLSSPATLNDYHRFSIKGRLYPAIIPAESKRVIGKVFQGVTDLELNILDTYEDEEYERNIVEVTLTESSDKLLAYTYVWREKDDPKLYGDWDFEEWKKLQKKEHLEQTKAFMEEMERPEAKTRIQMLTDMGKI